MTNGGAADNKSVVLSGRSGGGKSFFLDMIKAYLGGGSYNITSQGKVPYQNKSVLDATFAVSDEVNPEFFANADTQVKVALSCENMRNVEVKYFDPVDALKKAPGVIATNGTVEYMIMKNCQKYSNERYQDGQASDRS